MVRAEALERDNEEFKDKYEQAAINMFRGEELPNPSLNTEDRN